MSSVDIMVLSFLLRDRRPEIGDWRWRCTSSSPEYPPKSSRQSRTASPAKFRSNLRVSTNSQRSFGLLLRNLGMVENALNYVIGCDAFRFSLVGGDDAMAKYIWRDLFDIFRGHKAATFKEGMGSGSDN